MLRSVAAIGLMSVLTACGLPRMESRVESYAVMSKDSADTSLGKTLMPLAQKSPGKSGVTPLFDPLDAFAARMLLIGTAQRTLDIQYYIWRDDITGNLMLHALREAARREVRVRVLLDDNGLSGMDGKLALLSMEPNVEIRLFNPFPFRTFKRLGFLTDFSRVNRRMHNKSFTVDGQLTIVGGRNIGDEYFGATPEIAFADLDVLVAGAVVDDVSRDFDKYWNSPVSYPIGQLVTPPSERKTKALLRGEEDTALTPKARAYLKAVAGSQFITNIMDGKLEFQWVPVRMVSDDPAKVVDQAPPGTMMLARLRDVLDKPEKSVDLVSPYFVPTQQGVEAFAELVKQGVRLRVLTNAMEATDVTAVHAGYAKYRKSLLENGIELYEMRAQADEDRVREKAGLFGSSGSSLHAKTFAVDGKRVFVGSFNFDPRSAVLNTELGFVIESQDMAQAMVRAFDKDVPEHAYQLELDENGKIYWRMKKEDGTEEIFRSEPSATWLKQLYIRFLSVLPIESLL